MAEYVKLGDAYFQQTSSGLAAINDPAVLRGLYSGSISATTQKIPTSGTGNFSSTVASPTLVPKKSSVIPTSTLGAQTAYTIPTAPLSNSADVAMAGATSASTQMTAEQKALADRAAKDQSTYDKLSSEINTLLGSATGQGAATIEAEKAAGVPQMQKQLQGINSQIQTKLAEFKIIQDKYAETQQVVEGRTIPMSLITGKTAELNRSLALQKNTFASEIGLLQAQAQVVQGDLALAKETANRAVDLKYEDIRTQIQVKMQQLDMIRDSLTATEKKQAAILESQYQTADNNLSIQIANEKDKNATLLNAMQNYPDAGISMTDTLEQANQKIVSSSQIYQKEIARSGSSGGTPSGTSGGSGGGTSGTGGVTSRTSQVLDGFITLDDLTPSEQQKVRDELYSMGLNSSTPPQWYREYLEERNQLSLQGAPISSEVLRREWEKYRNRILGGSTSSSGGLDFNDL